MDRFAQQGQHASASHRAEDVDNGGQDRERRTHAKSRKAIVTIARFWMVKSTTAITNTTMMIR